MPFIAAKKDTGAAVPCRAGVSLKPEHVGTILEELPDIGFFEVHAENYMGAGGPPHRSLTAVRACYPISIHGVGLSIGGAAPLDPEHLARLKAVVDRYEPGLVSEHLAWSSHGGRFLNDLLPVSYNQEALAIVCQHVDQVQTALRREILLENPACYVAMADSTSAEPAFLADVAARSGCGLLLDVANIVVSAANRASDVEAYLRACPMEHVRQIHLAGYSSRTGSDGPPLLVDTHSTGVPGPVAALFADALARRGPVPTLIEWDNDVPAWPVLAAEAARADAALRRAAPPDGEPAHGSC